MLVTFPFSSYTRITDVITSITDILTPIPVLFLQPILHMMKIPTFVTDK